MSFVKVDEELVRTAKGKTDKVNADASSLKNALSTLKSNADQQIQDNLDARKGWIEGNLKPDTDLPEDEQDWGPYDTAHENAESAAKGAWDAVATNYDSALGAINKIISKMGSASKGLQLILSAVEEFNSKVNMENEFKALGITVSIEMGDNANGGSTPIIYYEIDGKKYTISELLNAYYTYTGMSMSVVVQGEILREQMGISEEDWAGAKGDAIRKKMLEQVNALTSFAAETRMFGLATKSDQEQFAEAMGLDLSQYTTADSLIASDETKDKYRDDLAGILTDGIGGLSASQAAVFGGAMGAYALASFLNKYPNPSEIEYSTNESGSDDSSTDEAGDSTDTSDAGSTPDNSGSSSSSDFGSGGSGGGWGGGSSGGGSGGGGSDSGNGSGNGNNGKGNGNLSSQGEVVGGVEANEIEEPVEKKIIEESVPGLISPTIGNTEPLVTPEDAGILPTEELPSIPEGIVKDYDDLARQQFEAQGEEAIEENRRNVVAEANRLFESDDKSELINKLKEYGYSDTDIETIIQDRDLTVSAMVSGDQRQKLAEIADELAKADGLTEFDTIYDNEQTAISLTDGTTEKLLANMSADDGVKNAYAELATAETAYNEANTAAVAAMASVTAAQAKLEELEKTIGESIKTTPEQWDSKTLEAYNNEVNKLYEEKVKSIGGNVDKWTSSDWDRIEDAKEALTKKLAYQRGTDISKWSEAQKSKYESKINSLKQKYKKAYGDDANKWSSEVKDKYNKDKISIYQETAREVGKGLLTAEDKKKIANEEEKVKNEIIKENGTYSNWTKEEQAAYEKELAEIKEKYGNKTSTATGEATWTNEQAKMYNDAVTEYNNAVNAAKEAMTKLDEAKTGYTEAKTNLETAKDNFFANALNNVPAEQADGVVDPVIIDAQTDSGDNVAIGGINITEEGATIGDGGTTQIDENGIVQPEAAPTEPPANVPQEEIVNDDEAQNIDYGVPIIDIGEGSTNSGNISNDDITF